MMSGTPLLHRVSSVASTVSSIHHVSQPTHRIGGTLDLVITKSEQTLDALVVDPPGVLSDHSLIRWSLPLHYQPPVTITREVRSWRKLDKDQF